MDKVAFGCNKGVLDALKELKKGFNFERLGELEAQAQLKFKPDETFKIEAKKIHKELAPVLQKATRESLLEYGFDILA